MLPTSSTANLASAVPIFEPAPPTLKLAVSSLPATSTVLKVTFNAAGVAASAGVFSTAYVAASGAVVTFKSPRDTEPSR